jgi:hypothetical protein
MQTICDFVQAHIRFDYMQARATRTVFEAFHERVGVCRDFPHLATTFCRCLNIPARYVNGHLGDIGVPVVDPMDFSVWIEVFLDGACHTFDPRNNVRRSPFLVGECVAHDLLPSVGASITVRQAGSTGVQCSQHRDRGNGRASEFGRDIVADACKPQNIDVQHLTGSPRRFEFLAAVIPQAEVQTEARLDVVGTAKTPDETLAPAQISVVKAVVMADSQLVGRTPSDLRLRDRFGVNLLGISRPGQAGSARWAGRLSRSATSSSCREAPWAHRTS